MFTFYIENRKPFGPLTKNCPKLDKNKSMCLDFQYIWSTNSQLAPSKKATM